MPRRQRLGRKPKKRRAPLASIDENILASSDADEEGDAAMPPPADCVDGSSGEDADDGDAEMPAATEPILEPMVDDMPAVRDKEVGWIPEFLLGLADAAVDLQEERNRDFAMYAAQATACKQAYIGHSRREALMLARSDGTSRSSERQLFYQAASSDYLRAYQEAHSEFSACCLPALLTPARDTVINYGFTDPQCHPRVLTSSPRLYVRVTTENPASRPEGHATCWYSSFLVATYHHVIVTTKSG